MAAPEEDNGWSSLAADGVLAQLTGHIRLPPRFWLGFNCRAVKSSLCEVKSPEPCSPSPVLGGGADVAKIRRNSKKDSRGFLGKGEAAVRSEQALCRPCSLLPLPHGPVRLLGAPSGPAVLLGGGWRCPCVHGEHQSQYSTLPQPLPFPAGVPDQNGWGIPEGLGSFPPRVVAENSRWWGVSKYPREEGPGDGTGPDCASIPPTHGGDAGDTENPNPWFLSSGSPGVKCRRSPRWLEIAGLGQSPPWESKPRDPVFAACSLQRVYFSPLT